jgi:hypothetical protein
MILLILSSKTLEVWLLYIAAANNFLKYVNENWYIGSIKARSVITKYKTVPLIAIGIYELLEIFIFY